MLHEVVLVGGRHVNRRMAVASALQSPSAFSRGSGGGDGVMTDVLVEPTSVAGLGGASERTDGSTREVLPASQSGPAHAPEKAGRR
jgi:hypothetical protein